MGDVIVIAPDKQMSCASHSMTTNAIFRLHKHYVDGKFFGYALNGTPADCVRFGIVSLLENVKPDIVLAGINYGRNTGINVQYSGTVGAATEGHLFRIPSFAISLASHDTTLDCSVAAEYAFQIVKEVMQRDDREQLLININVPVLSKENIKGIKIVKTAESWWEDEYEKRIDPVGNPYYWFEGSYVYDDADRETDDVAVDDGYVAVTPLEFTFTKETLIEGLRGLERPLQEKTDTPSDAEPESVKLADAELEKLLDDKEKIAE
jgi:5'-nucleotidase